MVVKIKFIQVNLGRGKKADDLALLTMHEVDAEVHVVSEPNTSLVRGARWLKGGILDVGVYFRKKGVGDLNAKSALWTSVQGPRGGFMEK